MGLTNLPYGLNAGNATYDGGTPFQIRGVTVTSTAAELNQVDGIAGAALAYASSAKKMSAGTVVVPTGSSGTAFVPTGLTAVDYVAASVYSTVETVAGYSGVAASQSGGTVTLIGISSAGTASTASGTATWIAIGS